jgi:alpha-glucosidase
MARRKGNEWFIGAINNHEARTISIPLNFLQNKQYVSTIYTDDKSGAANPNKPEKNVGNVYNQTNYLLEMAKGGGIAIHLRPKPVE